MTLLHEEATFEDACHLNVGVSSTGVMGGDAGHGVRTEVTLANSFGNCGITGTFDGATAAQVDQLTIRVEGDAELVVLAKALEWAGRKLRETAGGRALPVDPEPNF